MTWPFENDTSFIEKKIASRSFLRDRMRNLFVVTAIILTTVLFTGLFTLGAGITASTQRANYILSGGDGHGSFYTAWKTLFVDFRHNRVFPESVRGSHG